MQWMKNSFLCPVPDLSVTRKACDENLDTCDVHIQRSRRCRAFGRTNWLNNTVGPALRSREKGESLRAPEKEPAQQSFGAGGYRMPPWGLAGRLFASVNDTLTGQRTTSAFDRFILRSNPPESE